MIVQRHGNSMQLASTYLNTMGSNDHHQVKNTVTNNTYTRLRFRKVLLAKRMGGSK